MLMGILIMALLAGCSMNIGGSKDPAVVQQMVMPTLGQQLIDLKKAKDFGALTDVEYEAEKTKLLASGDNVGKK